MRKSRSSQSSRDRDWVPRQGTSGYVKTKVVRLAYRGCLGCSWIVQPLPSKRRKLRTRFDSSISRRRWHKFYADTGKEALHGAGNRGGIPRLTEKSLD